MKVLWPITIIGVGGIGGVVAQALAQYHGGRGDCVEMTLVDGDVFESNNISRQYFENLENKAGHIARLLSGRFPNMVFRSYPEYINERNAFIMLKEKHVIISCVDDHSARKIISLQCEELNDCILINGGNEILSGASQLCIRRAGVWLTPPLHGLYPHILEAVESSLRVPVCGTDASSHEQSFLVNFAIATDMIKLYHYCVACSDVMMDSVPCRVLPPVNEIFTDLVSLKTRSIMHIPDAYGGSYE